IHTQWLLILDSADDLTLAFDFLPIESKGHILLTTRLQATGRSVAHSIEVEKMNQEEGILLLLKRTKKLRIDTPLADTTPEDREKAEAIVTTLDGLPLALDQAGVYIEETGCSLADYLRLYQTRRKELMDWPSSLSSDTPEKTIATTWSLSFQKVEKANRAAAELLRLCAFLAPDAIPVEI